MHQTVSPNVSRVVRSDGLTGRGLVIEHIVPINLITDALVRGEQTVDAYLATLRSM